MKTDTKNKYIERLGVCCRLLMKAVEAEQRVGEGEEVDQDRQQRLLDVFGEVQAVQGKLLDGKYLSSIEASNEIHNMELKVRRLLPSTSAPADDLEGQPQDAQTAKTRAPIWNAPLEITEDTPDIVRKVADAQRIMLETYEAIVRKNAIAAHVPAVMELQVTARNLNALMQGLAKVGALL